MRVLSPPPSTAAARPAPGLGAYCIAKAGVEALTRQTALEFAGRIRCKCVPSFLVTVVSPSACSQPCLSLQLHSACYHRHRIPPERWNVDRRRRRVSFTPHQVSRCPRSPPAPPPFFFPAADTTLQAAPLIPWDDAGLHATSPSWCCSLPTPANQVSVPEACFLATADGCCPFRLRPSGRKIDDAASFAIPNSHCALLLLQQKK